MGAFWQVFVIFGVHWGFVPLMMQDISTHGYSLINGPLFAAVLAQSGATAAVFRKTRNRELKELAGPAAISAFLAGITEPAIYGVTLRLKKPFIYGCISGAVGGAIAAAGGSAAQGFVIPGAITLTTTMNIGSFPMWLIGSGLAIVIAFTLTVVLGFKDIPAVEAADESAVPSEDVAIAAPVAGRAVPLSAVPDTLFSSGAMGEGPAVIPSEGKVFAPISGTLVAVNPHAFGIRAADGLEVLVHVGLDTVDLAGRYFISHVAQGDRVEIGQLLTEFDIDGIVGAGYNPMTVMIVTNSGRYAAVLPLAHGDVSPAERVLDVVA